MKGECGTFKQKGHYHLHSNMDRFERMCQYLPECRFLNLHSNMDRFERQEKLNLAKSAYDIYIPIWIDLKARMWKALCKCSKIYIPIWIDLKGQHFFYDTVAGVNLHSNMDRFER